MGKAITVMAVRTNPLAQSHFALMAAKEMLFLSPGVRYHVTGNLAVYALMQFAVYRRVNGIQLTSDWNVTSGIYYRFNLFSRV
jgi:hypothetical protein